MGIKANQFPLEHFTYDNFTLDTRYQDYNSDSVKYLARNECKR